MRLQTAEKFTASYRVRLVLGYSAIVALFAVAWGWSLYGPVTQSLVLQQERALESAASAGAVLVARGVAPAEVARTLRHSVGVRLTVVDSGGLVLADSEEDPARMENHRDRPEIVAALEGRVGRQQRISRTEGTEQLYVAVPARTASESIAVRASENVASISSVVARARRSGVVLLMLSLALAGVIGSAVSRGLADPVERLAHAAKQMATGNLGADVPEPTGELGVMADALRELRNQIRSRIDDLEQQRATLVSVLDGLRDSVLLVHGDRIVYANSAVESIFRTGASAFRDRVVSEAGLPAALAARIEELLSAGQPAVEETAPDPTGRSFRITLVPLASVEGVSRALVVIADNTERAQLERIRRDFVANASHELKTPVAGIQLLAESAAQAAEDGDDDQAIVFARQIKSDSMRLRRLVTDLLDLSRLETTPAPESIANVREAIGNAVAGHLPTAQAAGLRIDVEESSVANQDVYAKADPTDVAIALDNLLDNAIAYTDHGGVTVSVTADAAVVRIRVTDTGVGIPEADLPRVFERFYRVDGARSRDNGGTGLGLALVRHAAVRSGGSVCAESRPGEGSTFELTFSRAT